MNQKTQIYKTGLSDKSLETLAYCYANTANYSKMFHEHTVYAPFDNGHLDMSKIIDNPLIDKAVIAAPRGIGKTTLVRMFVCKAVHYKMFRFVCYISKSETHAMMQTENIKYELMSSDRGKELFQPIRIKDVELGVKDDFSKKAWVASNYTLILPRGSGQQVRGLNWRGFRPDLFIIDDLEDDETIDNEEIRKSRYQWFYTNVLEARPQIQGKYQKQSYKMIYIDTVKHEDALILNLAEDPQFLYKEFPVCDEKYKTNFPIHKPQDVIDADVKGHRKRKTLDFFAREFMCKPGSREDASFNANMFKYYTENDRHFLDRLKAGKIETIMIVDPAKTAKMSNAHTAIVVIGLDLENNKFYVREAGGYYMSPDDLYNAIFEKAAFYKIQTVGIEETGLNEFIKSPLTNEMLRRGLYLEIVWLVPRGGRSADMSGYDGGKNARIGHGLLPYYRLGLMYHNESSCNSLETQLLGFPRSKKKDIMDGAAYLPQMLQFGDRWMSETEKKTESKSAVDAEYDELFDEYDKDEYDYNDELYDDALDLAFGDYV